MATIKSYTDLEQSKQLAEILPLESADMFYSLRFEYPVIIGDLYDNIPHYNEEDENGDIPAWSLSALIDVLPAKCECMSLEHINYGNNHKKYFMSYIGGENTEDYDNPVDACVEMIKKLHEKKLL